MKVFLWILQILLALHTVIGALWKLSNSEQGVPSLSAIPHELWLFMSILEIFCSIFLILPLFKKSFTILATIGASLIALEMISFCILQTISRIGESYQMVYWIVVAIVCLFIALHRFKNNSNNE